MPKVNWGINAETIDNFDRDSQFKPYDGPLPPDRAVFQFRVKQVKYIAGTREKNPQLRAGLELVPRRSNPDDRRYKGYYITAFMAITERNEFAYVPFLDALGVSATDFTNRTISNEQGDIKRIGRWQNDGKTLIRAQIKDGSYNDKPTKDIGTFLVANDDDVDDGEDYDDDDVDEDTDYDDEEVDEYYGDGEEEYDEDEEEEEEPPPPPRRRAAPVKRAATKPAPRRRRRIQEEPF